jgi:hypothetical protein
MLSAFSPGWRFVRDPHPVSLRNIGRYAVRSRRATLESSQRSRSAGAGKRACSLRDSPLPSLFKERLFVHLSRFCEVRYCIVRHVGFLIGQGRPAGDADAASETVEQVIEMLRRPLPEGPAFTKVLERLERVSLDGRLPEPRSECEIDLFER